MKIKNIGIYDKWLSTLGGGEKVATTMAECLSEKGYKVDLISNTEVERSEVEEKMGVNLSKTNFVFWSERSYEKLSPLTKKYDLFINTSYFDHLPSLAKRSLYYVHFPTPIKRSILGLVKYQAILPFLRRYLIIPEITKGLGQIDEIVVRGGKWLSHENTFVISNPPNNINIKLRFYAEKLNIRALESVSFIAKNAVLQVKDKYIDHQNNVLTYTLMLKMIRKENLVLRICTSEKPTENAIGLVSLTIRDPRYVLWNFLKRYLPTYEMALYGSASYKIAEGLDTYDLFLTNSIFSKKWTNIYWGKLSTVLNPPVDVEKILPKKKSNIILNVGRFFVGGHSKRQDVLLDTFIRMRDAKDIPNDWELHFVGGVSVGDEHRRFLDDLIKKAEGYPIYFHISADFNELLNLFGKARIYWHATGYGVDETRDPIKMEHFGITPVEAMGAGCIPIVFNGGGLVETVGVHKELLWNSIDELKNITLKVLHNKTLQSDLKLYYFRKSKMYSKNIFTKKFVDSCEKLINEKE